MTKEQLKGIIAELKETEKKFVENVDAHKREVAEKRRQEEKQRRKMTTDFMNEMKGIIKRNEIDTIDKLQDFMETMCEDGEIDKRLYVTICNAWVLVYVKQYPKEAMMLMEAIEEVCS